MQTFVNETFDGLFDRNSGAVYSDFEFTNCTFHSCSLSLNAPPTRRTTVRRVIARHCSTEISGGLGPAVFEDVLVDTLSIRDQLRVNGGVFKHVITLCGTFGNLMLHNKYAPAFLNLDGQDSWGPAYAVANARYYEDVDWALDITRARFRDFDCRGIPTRLIRRDPETQVVLCRRRLEAIEWSRLDVGESDVLDVIRVHLEMIKDEDILLVASAKSSRTLKTDVQAFEVLRREGLVESD